MPIASVSWAMGQSPDCLDDFLTDDKKHAVSVAFGLNH